MRRKLPSLVESRVNSPFFIFASNKIIDLNLFKEAKKSAKDLQKTVITDEKLSNYNPLHALYTYAQNHLSVLTEQLSEFPALAKLCNAYVDAEEKYMPGWPPMSPISRSYFTSWGSFDLTVNTVKETFATIAIEVCKAMGADKWLLDLFERMQKSRMGLYMHEGVSPDGEYVFLREFVTNAQITVFVGSRYMGQTGEIWLVRIMPGNFQDNFFDYSLVFTSPYVIGSVSRNGFIPKGDYDGWVSFFDRTLLKIGNSDRNTSYEHLMKFGLNRTYWNEYIFEAYSGYSNVAIFLTGFPDIAASRPHAK